MKETYKKYSPEIVKKLDQFKILLYSLGGFSQRDDTFDFSLDTLKNGEVEQIYVYIETNIMFDGFDLDLRRDIDKLNEKISLVLGKFNLSTNLDIKRGGTTNWSGIPMINKIEFNSSYSDNMVVELHYFIELITKSF